MNPNDLEPTPDRVSDGFPDQIPDSLIDRTLHALGNTHPAHDFANRLQVRLQARLEQTSLASASPRPPRALLTPVRQLLALSALALLCSLIVLHRRNAPGPASATYPPPQSRAQETTSSPSDTAFVPSNASPESQAPPRQASAPVAQQGASPRHSHPLRAQTQAPAPWSQGPPDPDAQALADLHTRSFPAPPLPPTPQERLIRLMLRRGEQHELAQLDPASVTKAFAQDQASFRAFFDPPPDPQAANQPRSLAETHGPASQPTNPQGDTHQ